MPERRTVPDTPGVSATLKKQGVTQLNVEIRILEGWIDDLIGTSEDNPAAQTARKTYSDMLRSRQELLNSLQKN